MNKQVQKCKLAFKKRQIRETGLQGQVFLIQTLKSLILAQDERWRAKENKREIQEMKYREARHMLQEKKSNGNYLYSYKEIAEELGISVGTVSNIAAQYGLSRLSAV